MRCSRGAKPGHENGSRFGSQASLSSQRTRFPWMRGCIWSGRLVSGSDRVRGGSSDHHAARHAHDAASGRAEDGHRAPSGTAKRANRAPPGTPHRTRRAASRAAHRTRRAAGCTRRHPDHHRAEKVIRSFGQAWQPDRLSAGPERLHSARGSKGRRIPDNPQTTDSRETDRRRTPRKGHYMDTDFRFASCANRLDRASVSATRQRERLRHGHQRLCGKRSGGT